MLIQEIRHLVINIEEQSELMKIIKYENSSALRSVIVNGYSKMTMIERWVEKRKEKYVNQCSIQFFFFLKYTN